MTYNFGHKEVFFSRVLICFPYWDIIWNSQLRTVFHLVCLILSACPRLFDLRAHDLLPDRNPFLTYGLPFQEGESMLPSHPSQVLVRWTRIVASSSAYWEDRSGIYVLDLVSSLLGNRGYMSISKRLLAKFSNLVTL